VFLIEQAGFLGDQYVAIVPTRNQAEPFNNGDIAQAEAPFNLQEFTRTATGFISRVDETIKKLNDAFEEVTRVLLNPETLTNLSVTAANLRAVSDRALGTLQSIDVAVATNTPGLTASVSNLVFFSEQLNHFAADVQSLVATNRADLTLTVKNIEDSSESLKAAMSDLEKGKGLAGNLLKNDHLAAQTAEIVHNLSITTSNLNRLGLWRMLWQHKPPKNKPQEAPVEPLVTPKERD
jgi:ABC-type transporter Mla subunit MlaD